MDQRRMELCRDIIREAGSHLLSAINITQEEKTDYKNLVTQYDKETQQFLMTELSKVYPEATYLCEEDDVNDITGQYVFVIDPIDGTANFTKQYRMSAISVALAKDGELLWGIVYNPYNDELFEAYRGKGAFLNGAAISCRPAPLHSSLVALGTCPYYADLKHASFLLAEKAMDYAMDIRRSGSAALDLCYTACGRNGVYFEMLLSAWDFAAGMLIVKEAGGIVTDFHGAEPDFTQKAGIISGNPLAYNEFIKLI